jgi:hypothetical protein
MVPRSARRLRSYAEFESYLTDFVAGRYPFLWVVGRPGVAKTESIRAAIRGRAAYYRKGGQLTPLQFYLDCYAHRGQPVILDDAEHLLEDRIGGKLISALGDTTSSKQLVYATTRSLGEVPAVYHTTSTLCIIANKGTAHEAIQSRAVTLHFEPTNLEIHRAVARWFWDQEIHDWFGQHLFRLQPIDTRWYVIADRDKRATRNWRDILLRSHALDRRACVVQDLETDRAYPTREDKARRFVEVLGTSKGASRASYFRLRRRLEENGQLTVEAVGPIRLRRSRPPGTPSQAEVDGMGMEVPAPQPEDDAPVDLPAHDAFAAPIRGQGAATGPAPLAAGGGIGFTDDTVAGERPPSADDDEGEDGDGES